MGVGGCLPVMANSDRGSKCQSNHHRRYARRGQTRMLPGRKALLDDVWAQADLHRSDCPSGWRGRASDHVAMVQAKRPGGRVERVGEVDFHPTWPASTGTRFCRTVPAFAKVSISPSSMRPEG